MSKNFILLLVAVLFFGCTSQNYFQLVETESINLSNDGDKLTYENTDVKISYNFWGNGGNGGFIISNKTDKDIFVDLKRSHLIINDIAFTYFQDRNFSSPKISFFSSASNDEINDKKAIRIPGLSPKKVSPQASDITTYNEERMICIPPHSSQTVYGFDLQTEIFRDCNLFRFPTAKQIVSSDFDKSSSPFVYRNRITYDFSETMQNAKQIENEFWAKKITNYPELNFSTFEYDKFCNDSSSNKVESFIYKKCSNYFVEYKLDPGRINH
jgi:hypothetical protein